MFIKRAGIGLLSGGIGLIPLLAVFIGEYAFNLTPTTMTTLLCVLLSVAIAGFFSGWLAGRMPRRRRELKVVIGATAGFPAAILIGAFLETIFLMRYYAAAPQFRTLLYSAYPAQITFSIIFLASIIVALAMITAKAAAFPLPPPRRKGETTGYIPAARPMQQLNKQRPKQFQDHFSQKQ